MDSNGFLPGHSFSHAQVRTAVALLLRDNPIIGFTVQSDSEHRFGPKPEIILLNGSIDPILERVPDHQDHAPVRVRFALQAAVADDTTQVILKIVHSSPNAPLH